MTDPQNERLRALEVNFEHHAQAFQDLTDEVKSLNINVAKLNSLLDQARGIRWFLGLALAGAGFLLGKFSGLWLAGR